MVNWCKNSIWYKIHQYLNENKKHDEINDLINEIYVNLNKNALILLKTALISLDNMYYVLDLLDVLKANYGGKHIISLTGPDLGELWIKKNMGLNYNYQVAVDSKNGMVVGQYLTQNATDAHELFEMLRNKNTNGNQSTSISGIQGYVEDNVIKYAYENNIGLLMPD